MVSTAHKTTIDNSNRIIKYLKGKHKGSTVVFFAGIHGNETAGVSALKNILANLSEENIHGEIYGVYGNLKALEKNKRFIDDDLNRLWTTEKLAQLEQKQQFSNEEKEQIELYHFIKQLLNSTENPIYFIDFHTTSSKTLPFITINDALINRKFSECFPVPVVLGIEEYLEGPLLSYLNKKGYVSLGFESGQHIEEQAIQNCESFIYLTTIFSGLMKESNHNFFNFHYEKLRRASKGVLDVFEVIYKYHIKPNEDFIMEEGYESFQTIKKNDLLATSYGEPIYSEYNYRLFMPLYQDSGNDGFFIIRKIHPFFLKLSAFLRHIKADSLLTVLPGITWYDKPNGVLRANLKVTRFLAKSIFHLFGYRNKQEDQTHLLLYNRERVVKNEMYKNEDWYLDVLLQNMLFRDFK